MRSDIRIRSSSVHKRSRIANNGGGIVLRSVAYQCHNVIQILHLSYFNLMSNQNAKPALMPHLI